MQEFEGHEALYTDFKGMLGRLSNVIPERGVDEAVRIKLRVNRHPGKLEMPVSCNLMRGKLQSVGGARPRKTWYGLQHEGCRDGAAQEL